MLRRYWGLKLCAALLIAVCGGACSAQDWTPAKRITLIVPVAPGSSNDLLARLLAERLPARLGQAVVVQNRPGAGAMIGIGTLARAAPDGHTIAIAPSNIYIAPHLLGGRPGAKFDVIEDLVPIITAGSSPLLVVARASTGVKTPQQLVAFVKRNRRLNYATPGIGSPMHVAAEMFGRSIQTQLNHVPYRGVLPAVNAVMAGELTIAFTALGGITPFIASGKLVPIAVLEKQRSSLLPDVPTLSEAGFQDVELGVHFQILAPAGTPTVAIDRWNREINAILSTREVVDRLRVLGVEVIGGSASDAAQLAREDHARYARLVQELRIRGQ